MFKQAAFARWFECALCFILGRRLGPNREMLELPEWQQYVLYFLGGILFVIVVFAGLLLVAAGFVWWMNRPMEALEAMGVLETLL